MPMEASPPLSDREMYELKEEAARYYARNQVPEKLEQILNSMFYEKPEDVYGRLSKYFESMATPAKISRIEASSVMDSTGNPAITCKVYCTIKNESKLTSSTNLSVAQELLLLPPPTSESDEKEQSKEVIASACIDIINGVLSEKLKGHQPMDQRQLDCILREWIDEEEARVQLSHLEGDEVPRTPTPSSGNRKKPPSGKGKSKIPDKPVPPFEPLEFRLRGCSAIAATSIGVLKAASSFLQKQAFEHLHSIVNPENPITFPIPSLSIMNCGKASPGKLNIAKNVFVIAKPGLTMAKSVQMLTQTFHQVGKSLAAKAPPLMSPTGGFQPGFEKIEQSLDLIQDVATTLGWTLGQDIFIGIECAAHEVFDYGKGKYEVMAGILKSADEMFEYYRDISARYPSIIALIDPLRKEDREQWSKCCETLSERCYLLGSEAMYGSMHGINASALEARQSSGIVVCPGGRVTLTDIMEATKSVRDKNAVAVLTYKQGDVCDTVFSDLAVGLNYDIVCFGAPCRGENVARLNRLVDIETDLKDSEISYREKFTFPLIKPPTPTPPTEEEPSSNAASSSPDTKSKKK